MRLFFSLGMRLMVLSSWSILFDKSLGWNQTRYWWVALIILAIFAGVELVIYVKTLQKKYQASSVNRVIQSLAPFGKTVNQIFHFDWLYQLVVFLFSIQKSVVNGFNLIFEGEGGILWALVFLVLLASLLFNGKGGL
jgi:hypothetical protein